MTETQQNEVRLQEEIDCNYQLRQELERSEEKRRTLSLENDALKQKIDRLEKSRELTMYSLEDANAEKQQLLQIISECLKLPEDVFRSSLLKALEDEENFHLYF